MGRNEKLPVMIRIIDNNEVINEFYKLIGTDLLTGRGKGISDSVFGHLKL
jgi:hypothetical protein